MRIAIWVIQEDHVSHECRTHSRGPLVIFMGRPPGVSAPNDGLISAHRLMTSGY